MSAIIVEGLTDKQHAFCREFLKDFNATQAAIRAGYSEKTARQTASENLSKPDIQSQIQEYANEINERTDNEISRIVTELQILAFGSLKDVAEWDKFGLKLKSSEELGVNAKLVSEISESRTDAGSTMKVKLVDKLRALEMLGRYHKMFTDKLEIMDLSKISNEDLLRKTVAIAGKLSESTET